MAPRGSERLNACGGPHGWPEAGAGLGLGAHGHSRERLSAAACEPFLEFSRTRERGSVCVNVALMLSGIHSLRLFYNSIMCSERVSHRAHTFRGCFDGVSVASPRHPDFPADGRCVAAWPWTVPGPLFRTAERPLSQASAPPGERREGVGPRAAGPHFALPSGGSRGGRLARHHLCGREGPSLCVQAA